MSPFWSKEKAVTVRRKKDNRWEIAEFDGTTILRVNSDNNLETVLMRALTFVEADRPKQEVRTNILFPVEKINLERTMAIMYYLGGYPRSFFPQIPEFTFVKDKFIDPEVEFLLGTLFQLAFASLSFAVTTVSVSNNNDNSKSNVHVESNTGQNTVCVNGKCTTTSGNGTSKSTVCINGNCTTSEGGDIDVESEDGKTTVHVDTSVTPTVATQEALDTSVSKSPEKKVQHLDATGAAKRKELKSKMEQKHFDIGNFLRRFQKLVAEWMF